MAEPVCGHVVVLHLDDEHGPDRLPCCGFLRGPAARTARILAGEAWGLDQILLAACRTDLLGARGFVAPALSWGAKLYRVRPQAALRANIRFTFQAKVRSVHSALTVSSPRSRNWRNPSTDLMMPNTGSGVCLRLA